MTIYHFQTFLYAVDSAGKKHQICYDERKLDEQGFSETIRIGKHECKANSSLTGKWTLIGNDLPEVETSDLLLTLQGKKDTKAQEMLKLCNLEHLQINRFVWIVAHVGADRNTFEAECHTITANQHQYERVITNDPVNRKTSLAELSSLVADFLLTH